MALSKPTVLHADLNNLKGVGEFCGNSIQKNDRLLVVYQKWQQDCVHHLEGEFAFAIEDSANKQIFAACDPMGIRPLFYLVDHERIVFAPTIEPLLAALGRSPTLNKTYLTHTFSTLLCAEHTFGEDTLYQEIKRLPGGHCLTWQDGQVTTKRYWYVADKPIHYAKDQDYFDGFYDHLKQAVASRLPDDSSPVALEVSGGIDSLAIATITRHCAPQRELLAYSNRCPDNPDPAYEFTSEFEYAKQACQHLSISHVPDTSEFDLLAAVTQCQWHLPGVVEDLFSLMNAWVYPAAQQAGAKVLLSGFGGDQVATQHATQVVIEHIKQQQWLRACIEYGGLHGIKNLCKKVMLKMLGYRPGRSSVPERYRQMLEWLVPDMLEHIQARLEELGTLQSVKEMEAQYIQGAMSGYMTSRPSFSNMLAAQYGIHHRYPMLDTHLLNYCYNVPSHQKRRWGMGRRLVRKALLPHVPKHLILRNDKTGATCPRQIVTADQALIHYFLQQPQIPSIVHDYVQFSKLQAMVSEGAVLPPYERRALLFIMQLERINQRFGFLD